MTRSRLPWLVLLGLLLGGWATAHGVAYRLAIPDGSERRHLLEATGHSYLDPAPILSLCLTLVVLGLAACLLRRDASRPARNPPTWLVASLPLLGFVVQEHLERFLHDGEVPYASILDPTFRIGLLLQLPFALAALLFARALLVLTDVLVSRLRRARTARGRCISRVRGPVYVATLRRPGLLALGHGQRAPPDLLLR